MSYGSFSQDPEQDDIFESKLNSFTDFSKLSDIGKGSFGIVSQLLHLPTDRIFAGKFLNPSLLNNVTKEKIKDQIDSLSQLYSDHIIQYYGYINYKNTLIILMEFFEHGSLRDIMDEIQTSFSEDQISLILYDLLTAIQQLHEKFNITHHDIKASNLLLSSDSHVKIADFGFYHLFEFSKENQQSDFSNQNVEIIGMPYWTAPEVILEPEYSFPSDIWSIGITAVELSEGAPPYIEFSPSKAMLSIANNGFSGFRYPDKHSNEFKDFVSHCVEKDPNKRWTYKMLLEHQFIQRSKKLNREKIFEELLKIEIPHLKVNLNLNKYTKNNLYSQSNSYLTNGGKTFYDSISDYSMIPRPNSFHTISRANSRGNRNDDDDLSQNSINSPNLSLDSFKPSTSNFLIDKSLKMVSSIKMSPKLRYFLNRNNDNSNSSENSNDKFSEFIDNSIELNKDTQLNMINFISKGREMRNQLKFVPFKIKCNQNAEISQIYKNEFTSPKKKVYKGEVNKVMDVFKKRLALKILLVAILFTVTYSFGFKEGIICASLILFYCFIRFFFYRND